MRISAWSSDVCSSDLFDGTLAYNPASALVPVARVEGIGYTLLHAGATRGGSIVAGQGGTVRLDGGIDPLGPKVLFVALGSENAGLTGDSRAAQWRSAERRVGNEWVSTCRSRWSPDH